MGLRRRLDLRRTSAAAPVRSIGNAHGEPDGDRRRRTRRGRPTGRSGPSDAPVSYVGAASANGNKTRHTVTVPAGVQAGDALLLFFVGNTSTSAITGPTGWTLLQSSDANGAVGRLWGRIATAGDAGSVVAVNAATILKADLTVAAYRGTAAGPFADSGVAADTASRTTHTTPTINASQAGGWLLSYWADKSGTSTAWTLPAGVTRRSASTGTGTGLCHGHAGRQQRRGARRTRGRAHRDDGRRQRQGRDVQRGRRARLLEEDGAALHQQAVERLLDRLAHLVGDVEDQHRVVGGAGVVARRCGSARRTR